MKTFFPLILILTACSSVKRAEPRVPASARACGVSQATLAARIADCNVHRDSKSGVRWHLVSYTAGYDPVEVWQDSKTGLVWGDVVAGRFNHYEAVELGTKCHDLQEPCDMKQFICSSRLCEVKKETACASEAGRKSYAALPGRIFGLPTIEEFRTAEEDGFREILPGLYDKNVVGMENSFWSVSIRDDYPDIALTYFQQAHNWYEPAERKTKDPVVRCVGR